MRLRGLDILWHLTKLHVHKKLPNNYEIVKTVPGPQVDFIEMRG